MFSRWAFAHRESPLNLVRGQVSKTSSCSGGLAALWVSQVEVSELRPPWRTTTCTCGWGEDVGCERVVEVLSFSHVFSIQLMISWAILNCKILGILEIYLFYFKLMLLSEGGDPVLKTWIFWASGCVVIKRIRLGGTTHVWLLQTWVWWSGSALMVHLYHRHSVVLRHLLIHYQSNQIMLYISMSLKHMFVISFPSWCRDLFLSQTMRNGRFHFGPQEDPDKVDGQDVTIPPWTASTREAQKTEDFSTARPQEVSIKINQFNHHSLIWYWIRYQQVIWIK